VKAVLFDLSGVMVASAFDAMGAIGPAHGMEPDAMVEFLMGPYHEDTDHTWHQVERGELDILSWVIDRQARAAEAGWALDLSALGTMLGDMPVSDEMVEAVRAVKAGGMLTSLVTNNVAEGRDSWRRLLPVDELFDDVVDSSEVKLRKPNPAIFHLALERLGGLDPGEVLFLDDHPGNLAGAAKAGIEGLLVTTPAEGAVALRDRLGL
jgi:epoxide hydrolase-like predicted phosphatase